MIISFTQGQVHETHISLVSFGVSEVAISAQKEPTRSTNLFFPLKVASFSKSEIKENPEIQMASVVALSVA